MEFNCRNRFFSNYIGRYVLALSLSTSLIATSLPAQTIDFETPECLINEILFARKIKALKKEVKKLEGLKNCKETKKIIKQLFKVKKEAEKVSGWK